MKTKILFLAALSVAATSQIAFGQGFVALPGDNLVGFNSSNNVAPLNVGIGVVAPTASLHTLGTLRFDGLTTNPSATRYLTTDASGNVSYSNGPVAASNAWLTTGNSGTTPASNFLGTIDNQDLVVRTSNLERLRVLSTGNVGINYNNPGYKLHVNATARDRALVVTGESPSVSLSGNAGTNPLTAQAKFALATVDGDFTRTAVNGDVVVEALSSSGNLIFGTNNTQTSNPAADYNGIERVRIDNKGFVGINLNENNIVSTRQAPTDRLHVRLYTGEQVRIENMPTAREPLPAVVIDANGRLWKTGNTYRRESTPGGEANDVRIAELSREVAVLREQIALLLDKSTLAASAPATGSVRLEIAPNPAGERTNIRYTIDQSFKTGALLVVDAAGRTVTRHNITADGDRGFELAIPAPGTYQCVLMLDGRVADTKQLVSTN